MNFIWSMFWDVWHPDVKGFNSEINAYSTMIGYNLGLGNVKILNSMNRVANNEYGKKINV